MAPALKVFTFNTCNPPPTVVTVPFGFNPTRGFPTASTLEIIAYILTCLFVLQKYVRSIMHD